jgi:hypothetical protein
MGFGSPAKAITSCFRRLDYSIFRPDLQYPDGRISPRGGLSVKKSFLTGGDAGFPLARLRERENPLHLTLALPPPR